MHQGFDILLIFFIIDDELQDIFFLHCSKLEIRMTPKSEVRFLIYIRRETYSAFLNEHPYINKHQKLELGIRK